MLLFQILIFLCITASAPDGDAVNPNEIKTLLANDLIIHLIYGNGARSLQRNTSLSF